MVRPPPPGSRFAGALTLTATAAFFAGLAGCGPSTPADPLQESAEEYVGLATTLSVVGPAEVDAYFGPPGLDERVDAKGTTADLLTRAQALVASINADPSITASPRGARLQAKALQLAGLLEVQTAAPRPTFVEESRKLYGVELPPADTATAQRILKELGDLVTGPGNLAFRLASFQNQMLIPADKRQVVFERALAECRSRTQERWMLPANEQITVEWTREVDSAWHRYEGSGRSKLQINPLAVALPGAALDVACHEGYPGHHTQFLLLEKQAGAAGLPVEDQVVLLRSPESVLREGAASYAVDLVWPAEERLAFERDVLFPLAGLPPAQAEKAAKIHRLMTDLGMAVLPILQEYRDGTLSFNSATFRLEREALVPSPAALLGFVDDHGAYVVGYTAARLRVQEYVAATAAATCEDPWMVLERVLAHSDLAALKAVAVATDHQATSPEAPAET